jgi:superfamily II DNA or RNA helicase
MSGVMQSITNAQSSPGTGGVVLRPYQHESLAAIDRELATHDSTLLVLPTGCGKTTVFAVATMRWVQRGERVLVLADREELLEQARQRLQLFGVDARIEQADRRAGAARAVAASVQTMVRRLRSFAPDTFTKIVEDECQHSPAASRAKIREYFRAAKVLGVTATPDRADGKALSDVYASVAYQYDIRDAIRDGYLVEIVARRIIVDGIDLSKLRKSGDFTNAEIASVMEQRRAVDGVVVPVLDLVRDRRTVVFAASVAHAYSLAEGINERRPGAACVIHGELDRDTRRALLADYAAGRYQFAVNVDVLTEGWDDPPTSCVVMARPTRSRGRFVQAAGRGLRPSPNKRDCLLLVVGDSNTPGLIGPADCLSGRDELADDVRDEIDRLIGSAQLPIADVMAQAEAEVEKRREAMRAAAVVRWHLEKVDPFLGGTNHVQLPTDRRPGWNGEPASDAALAEIERLTTNAKGEVSLPRDKLPAGFSRADAWRLITVLKHRERNNLCTYAQAKRLAAFIDTVTLSRRDAGRLMKAGAERGWPDGVRHEAAAIRAEHQRERERQQDQHSEATP